MRLYDAPGVNRRFSHREIMLTLTSLVPETTLLYPPRGSIKFHPKNCSEFICEHMKISFKDVLGKKQTFLVFKIKYLY